MTHPIPDAAAFVLTHVASQLIYKWLEPPSGEILEDPVLGGESTRHWDEARWSIAASRLAAMPADVVPWWRFFVARRAGSVERLAEAAREQARRVAKSGATYVTWADPRYPALLRTITDPPLGLTWFGDSSVLDLPALAIVGSRRASGRAMAESYALGRELARAGAAVVSGGAYGCDIAAHHGVLAWMNEGVSGPAPAVVVFAGGIDCPYPSGNEHVFRRLRHHGGVFLSERLMGMMPRPFDFPVRNRVVAGLSRDILVMMAADRSGAMVTARLALNQGRDVSVLTHDEDDARVVGSLRLLRDGAFGFASAEGYIDARLK